MLILSIAYAGCEHNRGGGDRPNRSRGRGCSPLAGGLASAVRVAGPAWRGSVRRGAARRGTARPGGARLGVAWLRGAARRGATGPAALRRGRPALPPFRPDPPLPFRTHLLTLDRPDGPAWRSALCGLNVGEWGAAGLAEGRRARRFRSRR